MTQGESRVSICKSEGVDGLPVAKLIPHSWIRGCFDVYIFQCALVAIETNLKEEPSVVSVWYFRVSADYHFKGTYAPLSPKVFVKEQRGSNPPICCPLCASAGNIWNFHPRYLHHKPAERGKAGTKFKVEPIVRPNCQTICCWAERSCGAVSLTGSRRAGCSCSHAINVSQLLRLTLKSVTWSKNYTQPANLGRSCSVGGRKSRWNESPAVDLRVRRSCQCVGEAVARWDALQQSKENPKLIYDAGPAKVTKALFERGLTA